MAKKKKSKVKSLTEEEYNKYLMALKDEAPVMVSDGKGDLKPQK